MMDAERWQEVQRMFEQAVARPTAERERFVSEACGGDGSLRLEVASLLRADAEVGERIVEAVEAGEALLLEGSAEEPEADRTAGLSFGKYEVEERIGEGGFGVVYRGRDPVLKRTVAIKACGGLDVGVRRRFFREGQIAAGLQHPNIVTVHELGVEEGVPYLVQEFLAGEDLRQLLERGAALGLVRKLDILLQVARGLQHAHRAGVLHRDVKPANILVLSEGGVKILDFGIAKLLDADSQLTGTGVTLGTVGYLAPEQLRSEAIDQRADVFSFGVVAYELITGERPFQGENFSQVSYQLLYVEPQAVERLWPECPPPLRALVHGCLEKKPEDRVRDFGLVIEELEAMLELLRSGKDPALELTVAARFGGARADRDLVLAEGQTRLLPSPPRRGRWPQVAGGLLAAAAAAVLLLHFSGGGASPQPEETKPVVEAKVASEATTPPPDISESSEVSLDESPGGSSSDAVAGDGRGTSRQPQGSESGPPTLPAPTAQAVTAQGDTAHDLAAVLPDDGGGQAEVGNVPPETPRKVSPSPTIAEPVTAPPAGDQGSHLETRETKAEPPSPDDPEPNPELEAGKAPNSPSSDASSTEHETSEPPRMRRGDLLIFGPGVEPPHLIDRPQPDYPRRARRRNKEARVVVKVLVDEEGKVLQAIAPPDDHGFGEAARQAALGARFEPATRDGIAGKMWRNLPFEFKVE